MNKTILYAQKTAECRCCCCCVRVLFLKIILAKHKKNSPNFLILCLIFQMALGWKILGIGHLCIKKVFHWFNSKPIAPITKLIHQFNQKVHGSLTFSCTNQIIWNCWPATYQGWPKLMNKLNNFTPSLATLVIVRAEGILLWTYRVFCCVVLSVRMYFTFYYANQGRLI